MKPRKFYASLLLMAMGIFSFRLQAQEAALPFKGTIQYRIEYKSELLSEAQLAQQPQTATARIATDKMVFDMAGNKVLADATAQEAHSLVNLSMMGLGKYHIVQSAAELLADTASLQNIQIKATDQTKEISGYTAKEVTGSYRSPQGNIEFSIWYVPGFCNPFFIHATQIGPLHRLDGFPLEYTIKTPDIAMTFVVHKLTYEDVNPKYFNIPSSYKLSTQEQMQQDIQEFMEAMQGMGM